jgi:hypothetical protein
MGGLCCKHLYGAEEDLPLDVSRHNVIGSGGLAALSKLNSNKGDSNPDKAGQGTKTTNSSGD